MQIIIGRFCNALAFHVHHDESRSIPDLVGKIPARLNSLIGKAHIITGCITGDKRKAECVGAVLFYYLKRIDTVT